MPYEASQTICHAIYPIITAGTIDERMAELYEEKCDTADLTLDGSLFEDDIVEFDAEKLYYDAIQLIKIDQLTIEEVSLEATWPTLKKSLKCGQSIFDEFHPPIIGDEITADDIANAASNYDQPMSAQLSAARLTLLLNNMRKKK